jgi:hypothetical protein
MEKQLSTYKHWADVYLDKENADKFFANMASQEVLIDPSTVNVFENEFLYSAFVWEKSNEGHEYWMDIQDKLDKDNGWVVI